MRHWIFLLAAAGAWAQSPEDVEAVVATEMGTFRIEFAAEKAPKHVAQFLRLAREGYYDGGAFHRVFANGLIQGGDPLLKDANTPKNLWGTGGLNLIADEFSDMKHERGVVSAVRIPDRANSGGSQFFVCVYPQAALDGKYSAFGRVTEGMDVVEKISNVPANKDGVVDTPVRIRSVTIEPKKREPFLTATVEDLQRIVRLETTLGTIRVEMMPTWAPNHARNFLKLAQTGWYDGTVFHRLAKGFVLQGGMASGRPHSADRWVRTVKGEFRDDVKHERGVVSMARGDDPDSADTSFFLMLGPAPHLDGKYSAFARIVEGLEVLEKFELEAVDGETPKRRLELIRATVEPKQAGN
jgi:cyclophilin family peptidyl-prolyl cis-trans isomerase